MAAARLVDPDLQFIRRLTAAGGRSLKKCYQCATCSVACALSPSRDPFPRKEMIWASWGLGQRLLADPDIWLCHQCDDCSAQCPRGARPGDVLAACRELAVQQVAIPSFLGRAVGRPTMLPLLLALPALIIFAVLAAMGRLSIPPGEVEYAKMFPHAVLNGFFTGFAFLATVFLAGGVRRLWRAWDAETAPSPGGAGQRPLVQASVSALREVLSHRKFRRCQADRQRHLAHLAIFYGFAALLITTAGAVVYILFELPYPMAQSNPFKILGNLGAAALFLGTFWAIVRRLGGRGGEAVNSWFDWFLLWLLLGVALTGMATEALRLADLPAVAYPTYFVHLVFVFSLFVYAPYSKMAHVVYRLAALIFAAARCREEEGRRPSSPRGAEPLPAGGTCGD